MFETPLRVLVCGGRDYDNRRRVESVLEALRTAYPELIVIEGGATGADAHARRWAIEKGIWHETYPANWQRFGRSAGTLRNAQMLREGRPDIVIVFPGGAGTLDMLNQATREKP
jgi:predicted Rossmann-fold nucleotide-binding protein